MMFGPVEVDETFVGTEAYVDRKNHDNVSHGTGQYVKGDVHTQGIESFWAMLKRAHMGVYHRLSRRGGRELPGCP